MICDITVAMAAPLTPRCRTNINTGSRIQLAVAPTATVSIPVTEYPCALMNGFMPVDTMDGRVPSRYIIIYGYAYVSALSDAPNRTNSGLANIIPTAMRIMAAPHNIVKAVFIMVSAVLSSPIPLLIENRGEPPLPNRLLKAVIMMVIGKQRPTPPRAAVPTSGILAM